MNSVTVTDPAKDYLRGIAKSNNSSYVWFGVDGGGCSGFTYKWDFADEVKDGTVVDCGDGIGLIVDSTSEIYILGSTIDFVKEIDGSFLKISNPTASSSCGCGVSFNVKSP